ncbi:C4-dicarboxylic acid transporter DauA [Ignatzschineria rhizosphaerae]|uniref:C4-dicarboxylic acid transporter DauA n=1 Tax=Ignatzschineria rhizosphaerae TaxID=2923279 RepID=A0ABY3WYE4_9GAMM|nr:C4-dicarboxylic acid transporter DauA [Ignatzschineria rhizosphaerae]UNM95648.1 C4-dicarboxylic acid transporter DauA [Ignatzschineria rhizosphaerae]
MKNWKWVWNIPFIQMLQGYNLSKLQQDWMGGLTVGMIAVPLSMALAINTGVAPQYGLYTSIVAGFFIAMCGGARFNISGPTAAFIVILQPITSQYGLTGLILATSMAGVILLLMGILRIGKMIHYVPYPVTAGFSTGIAIVIAMTQIPDLLGINDLIQTDGFIERISAIFQMVPQLSWGDLGLALFTLLGLVFLPKVFSKMPPHLIVLGLSALVGVLLANAGLEFRTIQSVFSYEYKGEILQGIPNFLPEFKLPWIDENGESILTFQLFRDLLPSAFVIAILGAIESLLCSVVADGMKNTRHNPNAELVGQGVGNIIAPCFGGFAATAALARTAANIRAGGNTPIAGMIHAIFVLLTLLFFAKYLGYLPMASLGAMLLMVAWSMADVSYFKETVKMAPREDLAVLFLCLILTVVFDMVVAVAVGMVLSSFLFMARMSAFTETEFLMEDTSEEEPVAQGIEDELTDELKENVPLILHYEIRGPFFFGPARKTIESLDRLPYLDQKIEVMIIHLDKVPMIDLTGLIAFKTMLDRLEKKEIQIVLSGLNNETKEVLGKAGLSPKKREGLYWAKDQSDAQEIAQSICSICQSSVTP